MSTEKEPIPEEFKIWADDYVNNMDLDGHPSMKAHVQAEVSVALSAAYRHLSSHKIKPKDGYFVAECSKCGFRASSSEWLGGGQIADTGDYGDSYCPVCGQIDCEEADDDTYIDQRELLLKTISDQRDLLDKMQWELYEAKQLSSQPSLGLRWVKASERLPLLLLEEGDIIFRDIKTKSIYSYEGINPKTKEFYFQGINDDLYMPFDGVEWLEETPANQPIEGEQKPFGISETGLKQLLAQTLKPEEIDGEARVQQDRIRELINWFYKYAMGGGNPKWFQPHAFELAYYIATNSGNRFIDLEAVRQAAFKEGVNITPAERSILSKIPDFISVPAPEAQPIADGVRNKIPPGIPGEVWETNHKTISDAIADGKEVSEELIGQLWENDNNTYGKEGINPHAYRIGAKAMHHKMQEEMDNLREQLQGKTEAASDYHYRLIETAKFLGTTQAQLSQALNEINANGIQIAGLLASNKQFAKDYERACGEMRDYRK